MQALDASAFPWGLVPQTITIHIGHGLDSDAIPGHVFVDADLLDSGRFAWATVQHEYAHEVDYFLFTDQMREQMQALLTAGSWWGEAGDTHESRGCERFASTLAWAYWQSDGNSLKPQGPDDEAGAVSPAKFRAALTAVLGSAGLASVPATPVRTLAASPRPAAKPRSRASRKG